MDEQDETRESDQAGGAGAAGLEPALAPHVIRDEDRLFLVFAYLGPLCLVPLLGTRDPFVRWHARQGAALSLIFASGVVVLYPFDALFSLVPVLDRLFRASEIFLWLAYMAVLAIAIERALNGTRFRVPWLSDLADQD